MDNDILVVVQITSYCWNVRVSRVLLWKALYVDRRSDDCRRYGVDIAGDVNISIAVVLLMLPFQWESVLSQINTNSARTSFPIFDKV